MTEQGSFREPVVSWVSKDSDRRSVLVDIDGRMSARELWNFLADQAPDVDIDEVTFSGNLRWERDATAEEIAERERWRRQSAERHLEWQRGFWAQMVEQYGPDGPPPPEMREVGEDITLSVVPPPTDGAGRPLAGSVWVVTALHVPSGISVLRTAEHKLPAMSEAIEAIREQVAGLASGEAS